MSGSERGVRAALLRAGLATLEPIYAAAALARNRLFDRGIRRSHRVPRPVISVGNLTTGGTGKTPVVRWIASALRDRGLKVAVLARGYGGRAGELGDEQLMLRQLLNEGRDADVVTVVANPDRVAAAHQLLGEHPEVQAFILDDGFQHRRIARDLDIVLLSATSPFGYGHVLPRGMLREPIDGLRRAGAVIVTHADQVTATELDGIERCVRSVNAAVPVYRAVHQHAGVRASDGTNIPLDAVRTRSWFALSGIGDPQTFLRQLESIGDRRAGYRWFPDHHRYSQADFLEVLQLARAANADVIVTTEKDWAKLRELPVAGGAGLPVWRVDVRVQFLGDGESRLWDQVLRTVSSHERR